MKGKNSHVFLLKKVGGALIRVGALNRDYTVFENGWLVVWVGIAGRAGQGQRNEEKKGKKAI